MKTKYQIPTIEYILADSENLLDNASLPQNLTDGQNLDKAPTTDATSGNLSRFNVWDDEED